MTTERDMLDKLRERYTKIRPGTTADRYARAEQANNHIGAGHE